MKPKNARYLKRVRRLYRLAGHADKSDLEIVRIDHKKKVLLLPCFLMFAINAYTTLYASHSSALPHVMESRMMDTIMFGASVAGLALSVIMYYRAESCRAELEDELLEGSGLLNHNQTVSRSPEKQAQQGGAANRDNAGCCSQDL
ncbi:hypothetical protein [Sulfuriroseicoccus oceanibius]|uniref:Uncharacterized protein n=1 Tax=Sulfuriroseicoccus oceanibius TaxID=2707525 RepID=A0A6B3LCF0_9BACT|nr:hypothetical protein [Sulfuriroseicoccus oceanibius]QQL44428.1 hypothetical protein G3M56_011100 [Sulfuriroseicoccus oceanibius]